MKVIVAGSRGLSSMMLVKNAIETSPYDITEIVSGTARGPDKLGLLYASRSNIPVKTFPADWDKYGKAAGYIRNKQMAEYADALIAIWDGESRGTANMIEIMKELNKPYYVFRVGKL